MSPPVATAERAPLDVVTFDRSEFSIILGIYGRMVALGEWRDYAIDFRREAAVFSIFRRASEQPIYRVEKRPKLAQRQGAFAVIGMDGRILKRGHDLKQVLRVFDARRFQIIDGGARSKPFSL